MASDVAQCEVAPVAKKVDELEIVLNALAQHLQSLVVRVDQVTVLETRVRILERERDHKTETLKDAVKELRQSKADKTEIGAALDLKVDKTEIALRQKTREELCMKVNEIDEGMKDLKEKLEGNETEFRQKYKNIEENLRQNISYADFCALQEPLHNRLKSLGFVLRKIKKNTEMEISDDIDTAAGLTRKIFTEQSQITKCLSCSRPVNMKTTRTKAEKRDATRTSSTDDSDRMEGLHEDSETSGPSPPSSFIDDDNDEGKDDSVLERKSPLSEEKQSPSSGHKEDTMSSVPMDSDSEDTIKSGIMSEYAAKQPHSDISLYARGPLSQPGEASVPAVDSPPKISRTGKVTTKKSGYTGKFKLQITGKPSYVSTSKETAFPKAESINLYRSSHQQSHSTSEIPPKTFVGTSQPQRSLSAGVRIPAHASRLAQEFSSTSSVGSSGKSLTKARCEEIIFGIAEKSRQLQEKASSQAFSASKATAAAVVKVFQQSLKTKPKDSDAEDSFKSTPGKLSSRVGKSKILRELVASAAEKKKEGESSGSSTSTFRDPRTPGTLSYWIMDSKKPEEYHEKPVQKKPKKKEIVKPQEDIISKRPCGGKHTLTSPLHKGLRLKKWKFRDEETYYMLLEGTDGHMYRGICPKTISLQDFEKTQEINLDFLQLDKVPEDFDFDSVDWDDALDPKPLEEIPTLISEVTPPRFCGGAHTKTRPQQKGLKFPPMREQKMPHRRQMLLAGTDGRVYTGVSSSPSSSEDISNRYDMPTKGKDGQKMRKVKLDFLHLDNVPKDFDFDSVDWDDVLDPKVFADIPTLISDVPLPGPRFCGGAYTKTSPNQMRVKFPPMKESKAPYRPQTFVTGTDGIVYRGAPASSTEEMPNSATDACTPKDPKRKTVAPWREIARKSIASSPTNKPPAKREKTSKPRGVTPRDEVSRTSHPSDKVKISQPEAASHSMDKGKQTSGKRKKTVPRKPK